MRFEIGLLSVLAAGPVSAHPEPERACGCCACTPCQAHREPPCGHEHEQGRAAEPASNGERVGVLELAVGLTTRFVGVFGSGDALEAREQDSAPLVVLTPGLEWRFGLILYAGLDVSFVSIEDPTSAGGRRSITAPGLRARMSFGVVDHLEADAVFGAGVALWSSEGGPSLIGWSRRMAFGGSYEVTEGLWTFAWLGSQLVQAGAAGKGPLSSEFAEAQPIGAAGFTLTIGVRSGL